MMIWSREEKIERVKEGMEVRGMKGLGGDKMGSMMFGRGEF